MKFQRFAFYALLAASICLAGCEMFASHTNPIAGWRRDFTSRPGDQAIEKDYRDYIQKLRLVDSGGFVGPIEWFEDGTGQHALNIWVGINDTYWNHVLIYDKNDKRIKVIIYVGGHYRS